MLFNREIDSGNAITSLLARDMNTSQTNDFALRILGQMKNNYSAANIATDVCTILQFVEIPNIESLESCMQASVSEDPQHAAHPLESSSDPGPMMCRASMFQVQQTLLLYDRHEFRTHAQQVQTYSELPCDLPVGVDVWGGYSCAQQQIVLLLGSVRLDAIEHKETHVAMVIPDRGRMSFDAYCTPKSKSEAVVASISGLLLRVGASVDTQKLETCTLIHSFVEACFESVFGGSQMAIMTTVFHVQMYLIAFLDTATRASCYCVVVANFNSRIHKTKEHMMLPEYLPHTLCENMQQFSARNKLPHVVVEEILKPLCV